MHKDHIIFYPFYGSAYVDNMKHCWGQLYKVIPWSKAENNLYLLFNIEAIVLNWIEGVLTIEQKKKLMFYKRIGIKIIWVFHNRMPHRMIDDTENTVWKENMRFIAKISDGIILHSRCSLKYLQEWTKCQKGITYVPHVDYEEQYGWGKHEAAIPAKRFCFAFIGQIAPYKNIELLIDAFKRSNLPDCELRISGKPCDTAYGKKIQALCKNSSILLRLGYLSDCEIGEEIRKADVLVLPYDLRSSMNSGAMIAAFSNKRTVVISNNAMAQDYEKEDFLYVYDYVDIEDHCQELKLMLKRAFENGVEKNRDMGKRAYLYTKKNNSEVMVVDRLKRVIDNLSMKHTIM